MSSCDSSMPSGGKIFSNVSYGHWSAVRPRIRRTYLKNSSYLAIILLLTHGSDGTLHDGTMHDGTLHDGTLHDGTLYDGTLYDGTLYDSTLYDGTLYDGTLYDGTLYDGTLYDGILRSKAR